MMPTPQEISAARAFLRGQVGAGTNEINPTRFAAAAKELGLGFRQLLGVLARQASQGQNESSYRQQTVAVAAATGH